MPLGELRIGVTGHRMLPDDPALHARVEAAVRALAAKAAEGDGPPRLTVVSALAEGADRLVAEAVLREPGARLEALLPNEPTIYEADFRAPGSVGAFRALLARADEVDIVPPGASRHDNFEAAGQAMLARIDVLLALWDGQPARGRGGTAEIVGRALAEGVPVLWIATAAPYAVRALDELPAAARAPEGAPAG